MKSIVSCALLALLLVASPVFAAHGEGEGSADKPGILLTSFGTSMPEAKKGIDNLVEAVKQAFPEIEVRQAYTSNIIRRKIAREQNLIVPTPAQALAQMNDEGFTHVYVMPSHIIPGEEYDDIRSVTDAFASIEGKYGFKELKLGKPFLASVPDCERMAHILARAFAKPLAQRGTVVVLMGHGTPHHIANGMYSQLQLALDTVAGGKFFVGTVEAAPTVEDVLAKVKKRASVSKVVLAPFMIVAGDHASNDMADPEDPESWISLFRKAGYRKVEAQLVGLGSNPEIAQLFVGRIREMMR
ncbi:MAG: sirohydrochlorin cobaltochelatase [Fretibacterium sp.]|nr:sirohydrochlorin cobaltochelatase [Fretibacterium sp.]